VAGKPAAALKPVASRGAGLQAPKAAAGAGAPRLAAAAKPPAAAAKPSAAAEGDWESF
jgi:hypothetical protein